MVKLNLTNDEIKKAQGNRFEPLPAGTYGAVVYTSTLGESRAKNTQYIIDYKITEGPTGIGRRVRAWYALTAKALFKLIELNKATDFPYPTSAADLEDGGFEFPEADEYVGIPVNITLEVQEYESVATSFDVTNGTLNSETGEPVEEEGEPVTKTQNNVKRVAPYDADKISTDEDVADTEKSGLFL